MVQKKKLYQSNLIYFNFFFIFLFQKKHYYCYFLFSFSLNVIILFFFKKKISSIAKELVKHMKEGYGSRSKKKKPVIAFGAGSFNCSSSGHRSSPLKGVEKALRSIATVIRIDEYNTSKMCSKCNNQLIDGPVWRVKHCKNQRCSTPTCHRDINAALNILHIFLEINRNYGLAINRPLMFRRTFKK